MASLVHAPGAGRSFGQGIAVKVDAGESPDFAVFESTLAPHWSGPPPHVHRQYDEAFYVLMGSVDFSVNNTQLECGAGSFVYVPRGNIHGFGNSSVNAAKILVISSPGALPFVEGVNQILAAPGEPDLAALAALYARHASEMTGSGPPAPTD